jgi:large conductance mechanosensitive channel
MRGEFFLFLKNYGVIGVAVAFVIAAKLNALVTAFVDGIIMPFVTFFIPGGDWRNAILQVGPFQFKPGLVLAASVDFLIVAWFVFIFVKKVLREDPLAKK